MSDSPSSLPARRPVFAFAGLAALLTCLLLPATGRAAGFEITENTAEGLARGGTGAVLTDDPSALYFNPALLTRTEGFELQGDLHVIDLDLRFQRDPLVIMQNNEPQTTTFEPVTNQANPSPLPFLAASWDLGTENFRIGLGLFAPPALRHRCFGRLENGECQVDPDGAGRHMLIESDLVQVYGSLGAAYRFQLKDGSELSIGASAWLAYQINKFKLAINAEVPLSEPYEEDPKDQAIFTGRDLSSFTFTGNFGIAWESVDGLSLAASYRPPMSWESSGVAEVDFPENLEDLKPKLTDDDLTLRIKQAGKLRFGFGYEHGTHPGLKDAPLWDLEVNAVWEDWSRVEFVEMEPAGEITSETLGDAAGFPELGAIKQPKGYRDTFSLRAGGSWGPLKWLTVHAGGYLETPAQPNAYTSLDFPSWERYAATLGASFHPLDWLNVDLGYGHVFMVSRTVEEGEVYNQIPLSGCRAPGYDQDACAEPGTPPGNPQNEGSWSGNIDVVSLGVNLQFN